MATKTHDNIWIRGLVAKDEQALAIYRLGRLPRLDLYRNSGSNENHTNGTIGSPLESLSFLFSNNGIDKTFQAGVLTILQYARNINLTPQANYHINIFTEIEQDL